MRTKFWLFVFYSFLLTGCGYKTLDSTISRQFNSISIPYFKGDDQGLLTDAVIKTVSATLPLQYVSSEGQVILAGEILSDSSENIGFQYDRDPVLETRIDRLVPNEGRREVKVNITLIDRYSDRVLYGPVEVKASSDYDFIDPDSLIDASFIDRLGNRQSSLFFSLGQLDSKEGAHDISLDPLYRKLALKIAEGIALTAFR